MKQLRSQPHAASETGQPDDGDPLLSSVLAETLKRNEDAFYAPVPAASSAMACQPLSPEELMEQGQGLVRSLALQVFRSLPVRMDLDDLIAYGQLGLAEAANAFDPSAGTKFLSFAFYRIRGAIYDGISKMTWTSRSRLRRHRQRQLAAELAQGNASIDSEQDASWESDSLATIYLASGKGDSASHSIDQAFDPGDSPSVRLASLDLQQKLRLVIDELPQDGRRLIQAIYFEGHTLAQAARRSGISKSWASRLHANSLDRLGKALRLSGGDAWSD